MRVANINKIRVDKLVVRSSYFRNNFSPPLPPIITAINAILLRNLPKSIVPVLKPRCIGPGRPRTQIPFNSIQFSGFCEAVKPLHVVGVIVESDTASELARLLEQ